MLLTICTLTFPDGQQVTGRIEARSAGAASSILYTGAVDRLGLKCDNGTPADLELVFALAAQKTGATLVVEKTGDYEPCTSFIRRSQVEGPAPDSTL
jgi:hypothetical protein